MTKLHVFNAGPCLLPAQVYDDAINAIRNFAGTGVSVLSISHRTKEWEEVMDETRALWKELLNIPEGYETIFFGGGASMGFLMTAMNFLERKAAYLDTGVWAHKAMIEAQGLGEAYAIASSEDSNYCCIPKGFEIPSDIDYLHITTNNTIYGTELREDLSCPVPLIADMSSDILSRPVDVSKYAMIYGGAQKNAGTSGASFAIIRKDALGKVSRRIPTMLDFRVHIDKESMFNTPPVFSIYVMNRTLNWIKEQGGVKEIHRRNIEKAKMLYDEIDRNSLFCGTVWPEDRSIMNVCFMMSSGNEALEHGFLEFAKERHIIGIKGHRSTGGFRASIYNACTKEDIVALIGAMREFEKFKRK